jgi:hypothetical protein
VISGFFRSSIHGEGNNARRCGSILKYLILIPEKFTQRKMHLRDHGLGLPILAIVHPKQSGVVSRRAQGVVFMGDRCGWDGRIRSSDVRVASHAIQRISAGRAIFKPGVILNLTRKWLVLKTGKT